MNTKILYLPIVSLVVFSANCIEIGKSSLMVPSRLGTLKVFHENNKFSVERNGTKEEVRSDNVSPMLRKVSRDQLCKFLALDGYIKVRGLSDQSGTTEYALDDFGRIRGGGPWLGGITFIAGSLATAAAAAGAAAAALPSGPGAFIAAVATVQTGMAATAYATLCATAAPTP